MKKIKELMQGYRVRTFKTTNGSVRVEKQLAHWFEGDEDLTEHFCYIYEITKNY
jgi:hypothetical protein